MTPADGPPDTTGGPGTGNRETGDAESRDPDPAAAVKRSVPGSAEWWKHTGIPGCCDDERLSGPELKKALHALGRKVDAHLKRLGW